MMENVWKVSKKNNIKSEAFLSRVFIYNLFLNHFLHI